MVCVWGRSLPVIAYEQLQATKAISSLVEQLFSMYICTYAPYGFQITCTCDYTYEENEQMQNFCI